MVVATCGGRIVGVEPLLAFPIAAGDRTIETRQPVDWIVHADHRRRGLFTRMTAHLLDAEAIQPELYFNSRPTYSERAYSGSTGRRSVG